MSRATMQADIENIYKVLGDITKDVLDVQIEQAKQPAAVGITEYIPAWQVKLDLLNICNGDLDLAREAFSWVEESADKVDAPTTEGAPA
ncbi:hypothetical protein SEA_WILLIAMBOONE_88 [Gordonia phage WilliamBoone]|nr:hypothetical protein SEA_WILLIAMBOONE_88 [Gordonia phage WilliamBoone]